MTQKAVLDQLNKGKIDLVIEQRAERFLPLVPNITSEIYTDFWAQNFLHWEKVTFAMDFKHAAKSSEGYTSQNVKLEHDKSEGFHKLFSTNTEPGLSIKSIPFQKNRLYMLHVKIESPESTQMQLF